MWNLEKLYAEAVKTYNESNPSKEWHETDHQNIIELIDCIHDFNMENNCGLDEPIIEWHELGNVSLVWELYVEDILIFECTASVIPQDSLDNDPDELFFSLDTNDGYTYSTDDSIMFFLLETLAHTSKEITKTNKVIDKSMLN